MRVNVKVKKLHEDSVLPFKQSEDAAGYDLHAYLETPAMVRSGSTHRIPTGISMEIPPGYFGAIFPRSGLATNMGLRLANCVGVVDSDYRGEIIVPIYNDSRLDHVLETGDRIAQIVILPCEEVQFLEADSLEETDRGSNGFGSTGLN